MKITITQTFETQDILNEYPSLSMEQAEDVLEKLKSVEYLLVNEAQTMIETIVNEMEEQK